MHLSSVNEERTNNGHRQPYPDVVRFEFEAFGEAHSYEMRIQSELYQAGSTMTVHREGGVVEQVPYTLSSYQAFLDGGKGWVAATLREDGTMHLALNRDGELLSVDPISVHERELHPSMFHQLSASAPHGMVAWLGSDLVTEGENEHLCGAAELPPHAEADQSEPLLNATYTAHGRDTRSLLQISAWTDCRSPFNAMKLSTGAAIDRGFYKATGGTVASCAAYMAQLYNAMNSVYLAQLNVYLFVTETIMMTTSGTYAWNQDRTAAACPTISASLDALTAFRSSQRKTTQGQWHQWTDCYPPPGTVGLAYVGQLCSAGFGTGITTFSTTTWLTGAHEFGHNFGAQHTFQTGDGKLGIMDYGDGKLNGIYQFNYQYSKTQMCTKIVSSLSTSSRPGMVAYAQCWSTYAPQCGNGVVEAGEDCDESSACCTSSCTFTAGSQCGAAGGECCVACKRAPSSQICGLGSGYCSNGKCASALCSSFGGWSYCGTDPANPCVQRCNIGGKCSSLAGWSSGGKPIDASIPNGVQCRSSPISTCDASVCKAVAGTVTYSWSSGTWTACPVTCGSGTQTRSVTCLNSNGAVQSDSMCSSAGTKPGTTQTCTLAACVVYTWSASGVWSTCNNNCGGGTQTQTVTCRNNNTPPVVVANTFCAAATKPATSRACNTGVCPASWQASAYSACTKQCGTGTQTSTVQCIQTQNGAALAVAASVCTGQGFPQPQPSQRSCNTQACATYDWVAANWGACSKSCASGTQTRTVVCKQTGTSTTVQDSFCTLATKPTTSAVCNTAVCPAYGWQSTPWTACSVACGGGVMTRLVQCMETSTGTAIQSPTGQCTSTQPQSSLSCNIQQCPDYHYWTTDWSSCSKSCGGGVWSRTVYCHDMWVVPMVPADAVSDSFCSAKQLVPPPSTGTCNVQACPTYSWNVGSYGTCSASCGGGRQTRTVNCVLDGTLTTYPDSSCSGVTKPATSTTCGTSACGTYTWVPMAWGQCSVACGGGTRTRAVNCRDQSSIIVPDANCATSVKPAVSEVCSAGNCPVYWSAGPWTDCSKKCETGYQNRTVVCRDVASNGEVASGLCLSSKPSTWAECNAHHCPQFYPQPWGQCSTACGDGYQNRTILCQDYTMQVVDPIECIHNLPVDHQPCRVIPCPHWHSGTWSDCSAVCGGGTQVRTEECRMPHDDPVYQGRLADDASLCPSMMPDTSRVCNMVACTPFYWATGTWSACSATCGAGTQSTTVTCMDAALNAPAANPGSCIGSAPASTRACNSGTCPNYQWRLINGPAWSNCSAVCGVGQQTRALACVDATPNPYIVTVLFEVVADTHCASLAKTEPATQQCTAPGCGAQGYCENARCTCRPGWVGTYCDGQPSFGALTTDAHAYTSGVPAGEILNLRWLTAGNMPRVSLLLTRPSWAYPLYIARTILNGGIFQWAVPPSLEGGDDYQLIVWFSPKVFNVSASFSIGDPCSYLACGQYGVCTAGRCECIQGYTGATCTLSSCAAAGCNLLHSNCTEETGQCECADGWTGSQCKTPPTCTTQCANGGYMTQKLGAPDGECSSCVCPNFWSGETCGTCSLQCQNGFMPDANCQQCVCGTDTGYYGTRCECRYVLGDMTFNSATTAWISDNSTFGGIWRFNTTIINDFVAALPGSASSMFAIQSVTEVPGGMRVKFHIRDQCAFSGVDIRPYGVDANGRKLLQHIVAAAETDSTAIPSIYNMSASLNTQLGQPDSTFFRGVVTSSANANSLVVIDPVAPSGSDSLLDKLIGLPLGAIIGMIAAAVVIIALVIAGCCVYRRRAASAKAANAAFKSDEVSSPGPTTELNRPANKFQTTIQKAKADTTVSSPTSPSPLAALPPNWTQERDDQDNIYFYNSKTGVSEWTRPTQ